MTFYMQLHCNHRPNQLYNDANTDNNKIFRTLKNSFICFIKLNYGGHIILYRIYLSSFESKA